MSWLGSGYHRGLLDGRMRLLNRLEEVRLVYNVVYACFFVPIQCFLVSCLVFVCRERVKRKKEGFEVG